jgi:type IV pilus assembly protein PilM
MANDVKRPGVWGIDLGMCALKAIRLEEEDGQIRATAFDYIEHPKILNAQPDADPDQLTREALEKFLSRNDLKGDMVAIGVPGLNGLARFVKLPPVDEKKIPDIVRFEAKQQIPFPLHEVVWGFQRLGSGTKTNNMVMDAEIGLFAMKRDMIAKSLQHFKDVGIEVHFIQMAPLALCNFLAHECLGKGAAKTGGDEENEGGDSECVVGLDIGSESSSLVITDGGRIIWQRPIPLGGNNFTKALLKELKLTFAKAEHVKRNAVKSPDLKKILAALKPVLNDFVSEVQRSLGYFTNTHRDANIKYMVGLGNAFRLPGLQRFLQEKLQLEVRKLQKIERLSGDEAVTAAPQFVENVLSFGVAHGLALQGLNATCIYTNLLPPEIAQERAIRAKKPWAAAAAAVLLLITPPLLLGYSAAFGTWTSDPVKKAKKKLEDAVQAGKSDLSAITMAEGLANDSRKKMNELTGGVKERLNWVHFNSFINEALPRPDGTHLVKQARNGSHPYDKYFDAKSQTMYQRWLQLKAKISDGTSLNSDEQREMEEDIKKALIQINVEAVEAMYTVTMQKNFGIYAPKGSIVPTAGWVIEIRGYTYHWDGENFVVNTLMENLMDLAEDPKYRRLEGVKLSPEVESVIRTKDPTTGVERQLVSCVALINPKLVENPPPGKFYWINTSLLSHAFFVFGPTSLSVGPKKDVPGAPTAPASIKKTGLEMPSRNSWRPPIGTLMGESFGLPPVYGQPIALAFTALPPVGGGPRAAGAIVRASRTEFTIAFVWLEPGIGI